MSSVALTKRIDGKYLQTQDSLTIALANAELQALIGKRESEGKLPYGYGAKLTAGIPVAAPAPTIPSPAPDTITADRRAEIQELLDSQYAASPATCETLNGELLSILFYGAPAERAVITEAMRRVIQRTIQRIQSGARSNSAENRRASNAYAKAESRVADESHLAGGMTGDFDMLELDAAQGANETLGKRDRQSHTRLGRSNTDGTAQVSLYDATAEVLGDVLAGIVEGTVNKRRPLLTEVDRLTYNGYTRYLRRNPGDTASLEASYTWGDGEEVPDLYRETQAAYEAEVRDPAARLADITEVLNKLMDKPKYLRLLLTRKHEKAARLALQRIARLETHVMLAFYGDSPGAVYDSSGAGRVAKHRDMAFLRTLADEHEEFRAVLGLAV